MVLNNWSKKQNPRPAPRTNPCQQLIEHTFSQISFWFEATPTAASSAAAFFITGKYQTEKVANTLVSAKGVLLSYLFNLLVGILSTASVWYLIQEMRYCCFISQLYLRAKRYETNVSDNQSLYWERLWHWGRDCKTRHCPQMRFLRKRSLVLEFE